MNQARTTLATSFCDGVPQTLVADPQAAMTRLAIEFFAGVDAEADDEFAARAAPPSSPAAPSSTLPPPRGPAAAVFAVVFAVGSAGLAAELARTRAQLDDALALTSYGPARREGPCTLYPLRKTGVDAWSSCDLDGDGFYETSRLHDEAGRVMQETRDAGGETSVTSYDVFGVAMSRAIARARHGLWDVTLLLDKSGAEAVRAYDDDNDSRLDRWVRPARDGATAIWIDRQGRGFPSEMEWRDAAGRVTQRLRETRDGWQPVALP